MASDRTALPAPPRNAPAPRGVRLTAVLATKWRSLTDELWQTAIPLGRHAFGRAAKVALDEVALTALLASIRLPTGRDRRRINSEVFAARELYRARGWLDEPVRYHVTPEPLRRAHWGHSNSRSVEFVHLRFDSDYEPHPGEPGRDRWLGYAANRTAHAWVLRHRGRPRPWLVCIHGLGMGYPFTDFAGFRATWLHEQLGLNVVLPVLPLHGPRAIDQRSGAGFISGEHMDTVHAEAQAMWDLRRLLSWVRAQEAPAVGVYGLSLGGYNAALIAALEPELACVIAGVPATCFVQLVQEHAPALLLRDPDLLEVMWEGVQQVLSVVSPLSLSPLVAWERRFLFGGLIDRFVPLSHVQQLWNHWEQPRAVFYEGSHLSFTWEEEVRFLLREALDSSGLAV